MSNHPVHSAGNANDRLKITLAVIAFAVGVIGFYYFSDKSMLVRSAILVAGLVVCGVCAWFSETGREFLVFARESAREVKKVVWPTRNETLRATAVVFGFVVMMAIFLWGADKVLEFTLYDLILGWKK